MQMLSKFASTTKQATLAAVLCLGFAVHAEALPITGGGNDQYNAAVQFPTAGLADPANFSGAGTVGWSFSLSSNQVVGYLGLYNTDLNANTTVGIWNSAGTLLTSGVFDLNLTNVNLNDLPASNFLWLPISTLTLGPGTYTIGAYSNADHFGVYGVAPTTLPGVTIVKSSLLSFSGALDKPTQDFSGVYANGFFGPNFAATAPIPVPAAFWLLGSGLMGLFGISKRKRTA
jgi:hypothetical protein